MRIVVHGRQAFGKAVLEALLERGDDVVAVYARRRARRRTRWRRPPGRRAPPLSARPRSAIPAVAAFRAFAPTSRSSPSSR